MHRQVAREAPAQWIALLTLQLALCATPAVRAHPNDSIVPRIPPATPYGFDISRRDDPRNLLDDRAGPAPVAQPLPVADYRAAESSASPYASAIIEPAAAMGTSLQAAGDHRAALPYLKRAVHLVRVNEGLNTASQLPLWERVLASQLYLGDREGADGTQENLLRLRLATAADETARQRAVQAYTAWKRERYLAREGFETYVFLVDGRLFNERELERLEAAEERGEPGAALAQLPYLRDMLRTEYLVSRYEAERKRSVEMRSGSTETQSYASSATLEAEDFRLMRKYNYRGGRELSERILEILRAQPEPDQAAIVEALVQQGDWHLWWHQPGPALRSYREAWALYAEDGDPATDPASLFPAPVELPVASPFFTDAEPQEGHLEPAEASIRFTVNRLGRARRIDVASIEARDARSARLKAYDLVKNFRFRPAFRGGDAVASAELERSYAFRY